MDTHAALSENPAPRSREKAGCLALARVIVRGPAIYIFDEPTSALDHESERLVQDSIQTLSGEATVILIAHRLSTVKQADAIYRIGREVDEVALADFDDR